MGTHSALSMTRICYSLIVIFIFSLSCLPAEAQELPGIDPTLRSGDRRKPLLKEDEAKAPEPKIAPPPPAEMDAPVDGQVPLGPRITIFVKQIRTIGNKVFTDAELAAVTEPYLNRNLTYEDLERIRRKLTLLYNQKGYINSGAVLPDQAVTDGVVTFLIVEGKLTEVDVTGNRWLRDGYYTSRIHLASGPPVNIYKLEERLRMLQQHPLVEQLHAELKPGVEPGQSVLALKVGEHAPFGVRFDFNNYQSPSVGERRGLVTLAHRSLSGSNDVLSLTYGRSQGLDPLLDISYRLPFTARETELGLRYRINDFDIVEEPFEDLEIESESEIYELKLRQPFWRSSKREFAVGLVGERLHSQSWLLGEPFSFSNGTVEGEATVVALRFFQEYLYRSRRQVVAAHSRFSWGLDAMDATINEGDGAEPDGQFFSWMGQFQWVSLIAPLDIQTIWRTDIQLTDDPLLSLEQMPVGGRYSVRGYRENQLVRDNGLIASLEARIPLVRYASWANYLHLAPFIDYGKAWYKDASTPDPETISSVGIGLRWAKTFKTATVPITSELEIYRGHQLDDIDTAGDTLQDDGIHFQLSVSSF